MGVGRLQTHQQPKAECQMTHFWINLYRRCLVRAVTKVVLPACLECLQQVQGTLTKYHRMKAKENADSGCATLKEKEEMTEWEKKD